MRIGYIAALALLVSAAAAQAQDSADEWSGRLTLYGWVPGIEGDQKRPDGNPLIDLDGSDVLDALDGAFFGTAELRRGSFAVIFDLAYADLGQDGIAAGTIIPGVAPANATVETTFWMATAALAYRPYEDEGRSIDLYAGARYYDVDADFTFRIPAIGFQTSLGASPSWVDAIVGVRGHLPLAYGFSISALADIGGFGIGESSNFSWQFVGTLDYAFTDNIIGRVGYRYLSIDAKQDDLNLDVRLGGPVIGVTLEF